MNYLNNSKIYAYADDTTIVVAHKNVETALDIMQIQLEKAQRWCHDHGLVINASKTKLMHIKSPHVRYTELKLKFHCFECLHDANRTRANCNVEQCNTYVEIVNSYKYLGVIVDQNFKWHEHIEHLRKKLRTASYMLYHLRFRSNKLVLRQAYFALVESNIRHGITAWGSSTHCRKLQQTQNQLIKILDKTKCFRYHINTNTTTGNRNENYISANVNYDDISTINVDSLNNYSNSNQNNSNIYVNSSNDINNTRHYTYYLNNNINRFTFNDNNNDSSNSNSNLTENNDNNFHHPRGER